MTPPARSPGERVVRLLMRVYPQGYREQYAQDVLDLFRDQERDARARGASKLVRFWIRTIPHLLIHGLLERLGEVKGNGGDRWMTFRSAGRRLLRSPGLSSTIVLTLALGIGANIALFSLVRGVILRPLPYAEPDRLVRLWETNASVDDELHGPSPWNVVDWGREAEGFESIAAWYLTSGTYRTDEWVEEIRSAQVTSDFFRLLGVEPLIGRDFRDGEVQGYGPVMLGHGMWQRLFGGDPGVVGRSIVSSGQMYEIVGVMPPDFAFPDESVETWVAWDLATVYADRPESRTWRFLDAIARLGTDQTPESAEAELDAVALGLAEQHPSENSGWDTEVVPLHEHVVGEVRGTLWMAFMAVLFILAMACVNVANLLLANVPSRIANVRLRIALGATRGRIVREVLTENLLLGLMAGAGGILVAGWMIDALVMLDAGRIPRLGEVGFDGTVAAFAFSAAVATTVLFGAAPLLELVRGASAAAPGPTGRHSASARHRSMRNMFVGVQVSLALVLLSGAGLFGSSLTRLTQVDSGLDPANVMTFRVSLDPVDGTAEEIVDYYEGLLAAVGSVPGVVSAGAAQATPMNSVTNDFQRPYRMAGSNIEAGDAPNVQMRIISSRYPAAMGMTLLEGEPLPESAGLEAPLVALVNETLAQRLDPSGDVVGSLFEIDFREGWQPYRIVGVLRDVRHYGPRQDPLPEVYLSHAQVPYLAMTVVARTQGEPDEYVDALSAAVLGRSSQPPHHFVSMESLAGDAIAEERFLALLLSAFGLIALVLAITGVSGLVAHSVEHRRREIGVRLALGADARRVIRILLVDSGRYAAMGLAVGLVLSVTLGRLVDGYLYDVRGADPTTLLSVAVGLALVAAAAGFVQARRVSEVAPAEALRAE